MIKRPHKKNGKCYKQLNIVDYVEKGDYWKQLDISQDQNQDQYLNFMFGGLCLECFADIETREGGGGRVKEFCSNACKMKTYRKRKKLMLPGNIINNTVTIAASNTKQKDEAKPFLFPSRNCTFSCQN